MRIGDLNDITDDINVNVLRSNDKLGTYVIEYRLETSKFRHIGMGHVIEGAPIGQCDSISKYEPRINFIESFNGTSHKDIQNKLKKKYPEEFIWELEK